MRKFTIVLLGIVFLLGAGCRPSQQPESTHPISAMYEIKRLKLETLWDAQSQRLTLKNSRVEFVFIQHSTVASVSGRVVEMSCEPVLNGNDILLPQNFISQYMTPMMPPPEGDYKPCQGASAFRTSASITRVVIDPGHGGKDPGAHGRSCLEKNVNLCIARKLQKILLANGFDVRMTRNGDTYPTLGDRSTISNNFQPDLFVSIHANAAPRNKNTTRGFETLYPAEIKPLTNKVAAAADLHLVENSRYAIKGNDRLGIEKERFLWSIILEDNRRESKRLASEVQNAMKNARVGEDRGIVPRSDLYVLNRTLAPSILVEVGFLTHPTDEQMLTSEAGQERVARAIASGIMNYIKKLLKQP